MSQIKPNLVLATLDDYPTILNMGRFYEYEMSRECKWAWKGIDGGYPSIHLVNNFKTYFEDPTHKTFLVKIAEELAGFVLLNQVGTDPNTNWNIREFFI